LTSHEVIDFDELVNSILTNETEGQNDATVKNGVFYEVRADK
jgi:hypothetical protein